MTPPYPAPYWETLTGRQKINDLVHKIAQLHGATYPGAYVIARRIVDAPGPGTYPERLERAGLTAKAIKMLCNYHAQIIG